MHRIAVSTAIASIVAPLVACAPPAPSAGGPSDGGPSAGGPSSAATSSAAPPSASAADSSRSARVDPLAPDPAPSRGDPVDTLRGVIEPDLFITMRLRRKDGGVVGAYFYDTKGIDIPVAGVAATNGSLTLDESSGGKKTGSFAAHFDVATGGFIGTWTDTTGGSRSLRLDPIARHAGGPAVIMKKRHRISRRPVTPAPAGAALTVCSADVAYPEVFALGDAAVESTINDKLRHAALGRRDEGTCNTPYFTSGGYAVHTNRAGVLSVSFTYDTACEGCAHGLFGGAVVNVFVATGDDAPLDRLLQNGARPQIQALLDRPARERIRRTEGAVPDDLTMLVWSYLAGDYVLEDKGLRLIGFFRLPQAMKALDGDFGVLLPWSTVVPLLDPQSPAAGVWVAAPP